MFIQLNLHISVANQAKVNIYSRWRELFLYVFVVIQDQFKLQKSFHQTFSRNFASILFRMSWSAVKLRDVRSSIKKDKSSVKTHRSASLDNRSRGSYVPEKVRSSSDERKSGKLFNNWGTGPRKSSLGLSEAKRKDTRPLADKAYQKRKVAELAKYLEEEGFSPAVDATKLMCPSKKDFENIFEFLYRYFDPAYNVKKIEEEAPKILKLLNYPYTVNKSAFVYVARTNWPSLLGVILWLMDLTKFAAKSKANLNSLFEVEESSEEDHTHKILFQYICQCHYSGFDDEEKMNEVFHKIIKSSMCNLDELLETNASKKLRLDSVSKEIEERTELDKTKTSLDNNIQKYEDYILKMKSHYAKKEEAMEPLLQEKKKKELILEALQEEKRKKQDLYDAQGFDGKARKIYYEMQKKELNEELDKKQNLRRELQDKYEFSQMEYTKKFDKVTASVAALKERYNSISEDAKVLLKPLHNIKDPQLMKLCSYYNIEFPEFPDDTESRKAFKNVLEDIKDNIERFKEYLQRILSAWNQRNNEIEIQSSELSARLKLLSVQTNMKENDLNIIKKQSDDEMASLEAQNEKKLQHINLLHERVTRLKLTIEEMLEELNDLKNFHQKKSKQLKDYLAEQEETFNYYDREEKKLAEECEAHGKEINETIEKGLDRLEKYKDEN